MWVEPVTSEANIVETRAADLTCWFSRGVTIPGKSLHSDEPTCCAACMISSDPQVFDMASRETDFSMRYHVCCDCVNAHPRLNLHVSYFYVLARNKCWLTSVMDEVCGWSLSPLKPTL